jgi:hypothetical protein
MFYAPPIPARVTESDDDLRRRVLYVGGDGPALEQRIYRAEGSKLDEMAEAFGLKRRGR